MFTFPGEMETGVVTKGHCPDDILWQSLAEDTKETAITQIWGTGLATRRCPNFFCNFHRMRAEIFNLRAEIGIYWKRCGLQEG
jgi:hypothetical protein